MNKKELKLIFARVLLPLGYTNVKDTFFRRVGDIFLIVHLEKSSFGGHFTPNIGIYVDESGQLTQPPPFHKTHLHETLYTISPRAVREALLPAMDLEVSMGTDQRSSVIRSVLMQHGLPFLDPLSTIEGIASRLDPANERIPLVTRELREIVKRRTGRDYTVL